MSIGKGHTFGSQLVQMRRRNLAFRIVGFDVSVAHVVGQNKDNVRLGSDKLRNQEEGEETKKPTLN